MLTIKNNCNYKWINADKNFKIYGNCLAKYHNNIIIRTIYKFNEHRYPGYYNLYSEKFTIIPKNLYNPQYDFDKHKFKYLVAEENNCKYNCNLKLINIQLIKKMNIHNSKLISFTNNNYYNESIIIVIIQSKQKQIIGKFLFIYSFSILKSCGWITR